ncbi:hypothetical protein MCOR02_002463 [Pyricularia oryzae]|uniref:Velvet complex subunit B n=2 Tax=Pyricularia oryzae TaxID=318829 RepID=VELB_PYRO7|nr:developmental regulator VelB [Pyricularia oryzae 70-15]G4MUB2.1 RecName: Full=Velvet complex subunit B [Pyricularia oryzae 70-15]KAH9438866.1 hypothetical protein MCOR02_002463 [Pyricularia oryzae]EHA54799.1 developmental regulator VelB [Pyricularia oryzae 70-15]KAI6323796.1 hypothetical protein MCOR30_007243 [Pyricularia oryzae]KAI6325340.1 hypothetical protein MCOR34_001197 [Pyricularia oryzae]KAI6366223.1 hypothetical protein MCOR32_007482 [Pyricularia oryzae]
MNPGYSSTASQPGHNPSALPHDVHHALPAIGHPGSYHASMPQLPSIPPSMPPHYSDQYGMMQQPQDQPAPSSTTEGGAETKPSADAVARTQKKLQPHVGEQDGRKYRLDVVQQPKRARMCGFGDKDRRPITPPPCIRLIVTDAVTGKEIDCNEIEHTMYVLNVDLWSEDAQQEVNLVRHTSATPSISSTTPASFAQIDSTPPAFAQIPGTNREMPSYPQSQAYAPSVTPFAQQGGYGQQAISPVGPHYGMVANTYGGQGGYTYASPTDMHPHQLGSQVGPYGPRIFNGAPDMGMHQRMALQGTHQGAPPQGMFTRNLIGSLSASAFRLNDPQEKIGIWFVLQDLSVRTEGIFRLRFSYVNVGAPTRTPNGGPANQTSILNTGKAPILASCFSDAFQVYSAKKFPGVCESTPLSKCFAGQGIKIPIRKAEGGGKNNDDDDDY